MVWPAAMNTLAFDHQSHEPQLVDYVDFKWLMANEGHRVDIARLQADPAYAQRCLALARESTSTLLRQRAERLLGGGPR